MAALDWALVPDVSLSNETNIFEHEMIVVAVGRETHVDGRGGTMR
jgi:hypothetical protein